VSLVKRVAMHAGSLPMQGAVAAWGAPSIIRSWQSGYTFGGASPTTTTILPVVPENCLLMHNGANSNYVPPYYFQGRIELTNATTVSLLNVGRDGAGMGIAWTVLEFVPGLIKSVQAGVIDLGTASSGTATINPVTPERSVLMLMGVVTDYGTDTNGAIWPTRLTLTNPTTITANRWQASTATKSPWRLVEFF
jgi:hypothetical protein